MWLYIVMNLEKYMLKAIWKIEVCLWSLKPLLKWKHVELSRLGWFVFWESMWKCKGCMNNKETAVDVKDWNANTLFKVYMLKFKGQHGLVQQVEFNPTWLHFIEALDDLKIWYNWSKWIMKLEWNWMLWNKNQSKK